MALPEGVDLRELDRTQIAELQTLMRRAGYDPGPADGVLGNQTWLAFQRFLSRNGLQPTTTTVPRLVVSMAASQAPEVWNTVVMSNELTGTQPSINAPTGGQGYVAGMPSQTGLNNMSMTGAPVPLTAEEEKDIRMRFPDLSWLLDQDTEIRSLLARAIQDPPMNPEEFQGELFKTNWWKKTSVATRLWDDTFFRDPAQAQWQWDQRTVVLINKAQQLGLPMNEGDARWLAGRVLREGWSDEQIDRWMGQLARNAGRVSPGKISQQQSELKQLAKNYFTFMSDTDALNFATRIMEGSLSVEGVQTMLRDQAKNRFTWLAPQIDTGLTPADLFSANRNAVAQLLEVNPDTIDFNDPRYSELTSPIVENGQMRSMNFYEAQKWARNRTEWRYTGNAQREASDLTLSMLETMGMIG